MQRHLSGGSTVIAALLAAVRPTAPADGPVWPASATPAPDVMSLLAELGRDAPRPAAPPRP